MSKHWTDEDVQAMARSFQPACVLAAGAELGVFDVLAEAPAGAGEVARRLSADPRAVEVLLDALAAIGLLGKVDGLYSCSPGVEDLLTESREGGLLAYVRHLANCLRSWAQLAEVVRTGQRAARRPSVRGAEEDQVSFIEAMHELSTRSARDLVDAIGPPAFDHLLDVGGGPGTWTIAFLRVRPDARATLFDLPDVLPMARRHVEQAGMADRVELVGGDLDTDAPLPSGADLAWVSAIIHMYDRQQTRGLFAKVRAALSPGGRILIRDVLMEPSRTAPPGGALFAVNMLVNTPTGRTYTLTELEEDLAATGFGEVSVLHRSPHMDSVVQAVRR